MISISIEVSNLFKEIVTLVMGKRAVLYRWRNLSGRKLTGISAVHIHLNGRVGDIVLEPLLVPVPITIAEYSVVPLPLFTYATLMGWNNPFYEQP